MMFNIRSILLGTHFLCEAVRRNLSGITAKMPESEIRVNKENKEKKTSENTAVDFLGPSAREGTDTLVDSV